MKYSNLYRAAEILLTDQGISSEKAETLVRAVIENPDALVREDGVKVEPENVAEFENWAATLSDWELTISCCGCDESEPNGPIVYVGWDGEGKETRVIIPDNCCRVLTALFDAMGNL